jgi:hypothetical protein
MNHTEAAAGIQEKCCAAAQFVRDQELGACAQAEF